MTTPIDSMINLQSVLLTLRSVRSVSDLKGFCSAVDDRYLNQRLIMADSDWPTFTQAVTIKMAELDEFAVQPGDDLRTLGASESDITAYLEWQSKLTPAEKMVILRRQGVPESFIESGLGAEYQAPDVTTTH